MLQREIAALAKRIARNKPPAARSDIAIVDRVPGASQTAQTVAHATRRAERVGSAGDHRKRPQQRARLESELHRSQTAITHRKQQRELHRLTQSRASATPSHRGTQSAARAPPRTTPTPRRPRSGRTRTVCVTCTRTGARRCRLAQLLTRLAAAAAAHRRTRHLHDAEHGDVGAAGRWKRGHGDEDGGAA